VTKIICGVDVSKSRLDAAVASPSVFASFANDADGIAALAGFCRTHGVELAVMEATGGFERKAFLLLWQEGVASALVNPRNVRCFAEAMGAMEKTDPIDAEMIARFAIAKDIKPMEPPTSAQQRLKALVARLRQVTGDLTVQKQRRSAAADDETLASLDEVIALLKRQSKTLEGEIASMIDDDPLWARLAEAFREIKGVAGRTVARLMADLPEIGVFDNKAVSKLVGLAPLADDSGSRSGQRHIRGGRASVRAILFLVADIARRFDEDLADMHRRLQAAGKKKMVIRIALARKLLVRLNAKARDARAELANAT
jgi:transposase